ncbi:hypothetical protein L7F22_065017 [Adiantum nelumboides]|nr:hypothetical protein [Adiantum nelumboides]
MPCRSNAIDVVSQQMMSPSPPAPLEDGISSDGLTNSSSLCINDVLTDDGLRAILSKLPSQSDKNVYGLVCKRWLQLQSTERQRLSARAGPHMLERIALRFTHLLHLDFTQSVSRSFFPGVGDSDLRIVATSFPLLEGINLCQCKGEIPPERPEDHSIDLVPVSSPPNRLPYRIIAAQLKEIKSQSYQICHDMQYHAMDDMEGVTDVGLEALGAGTSTLRWIDLTDCGRVTDKGVEALVRGCSQMQALRLSGCKLVTDRGVEALGKWCKELAELSLHRCNKITDGGLLFLSQGCKCLRMLDVSLCTKIASLGVQSIARSCSELRSMNLCSCLKVGNGALQSLAECCTSLEQLKVNGCRMISDEGIIELVKCCGSTLKELDFGWLNVADEAVGLIFLFCPTIEVLNLESCSRITDSCFAALNNDGVDLRVLNLSFCPGITNASVVKIVNVCTQLQTLDLRFCGLVDPIVVRSLSFPEGCQLSL